MYFFIQCSWKLLWYDLLNALGNEGNSLHLVLYLWVFFNDESLLSVYKILWTFFGNKSCCSL